MAPRTLIAALLAVCVSIGAEPKPGGGGAPAREAPGPSIPARPDTGASASLSAPATPSEGRPLPRRLLTENLPNAVQLHPKVISGGLPEGDAAFAELARLGVQTVISVDGMTPDVATARRHGLRYVHLPHGYDGVPADRARELAKAVVELPGPIYLHCHHGKHRSPAAACVACVAAGYVPPTQGVAALELAGTSPHYRGLWQSARDARPLDEALLAELKVEFRETAAVAPMAEAMVALEQTHHHLKLIAEAGWRSPPSHPDLDPAHEALLLREHFTEMLRTEEVRSESEAFRLYLRESEEAALTIEKALADWRPTSAGEPAPTTVQRAAALISAHCKACHVRFRDVPLGEK